MRITILEIEIHV